MNLLKTSITLNICTVRCLRAVRVDDSFRALILAISFALGFSARISAEPNLEGVTGILNVPSAESLEDGEVFFGYGYNTNRDRFLGARQRNYIAGVGYLPGLEVCARYIEFPEIQEPVVPGFGTRKDRSVNVKYQFVCESCHKISLAVGAYDVGGKAKIESATYFTGTKTVGPLKLTLGFGSKRLSGVFGGAEFKLSDEVALLYEYDRFDNNFGVRVKPSSSVNLLVGRVNDDFAFGFSYLKDLVPRKGREEKVSEPIKRESVSAITDLASLEQIGNELARLGYENVEVKGRKGELAIKYENRLKRLEEEAWASVILFASVKAPEDVSEIRVVSRREGELLVNTRVNRSAVINYVNGEIDANEFSRSLKVTDYEPPSYAYDYETELINPSRGTTDVFLTPANTLRLGEAFQPVKHRSGLAISHDTSFGGGFSLTGKLEVPLVNSLDERDAPFMRNETLNFYASGANGVDWLFSGGYFGEHLYGAKGEVRRFFPGDPFSFDVGVEGGIAKDEYYDLTEDEFLVSATWRHQNYDLSVRGYTGRFLRGDQGWFLETKRYLGKHEVAFFAYNTDAISTEAGFRYTIPIIGYSDDNYARMRFSIAPLFTYEYRTTSLLAGEFLAPRVSVEDFRKRLYPFYLRERVDLIRKVAHDG